MQHFSQLLPSCQNSRWTMPQRQGTWIQHPIAQLVTLLEAKMKLWETLPSSRHKSLIWGSSNRHPERKTQETSKQISISLRSSWCCGAQLAASRRKRKRTSHWTYQKQKLNSWRKNKSWVKLSSTWRAPNTWPGEAWQSKKRRIYLKSSSTPSQDLSSKWARLFWRKWAWNHRIEKAALYNSIRLYAQLQSPNLNSTIQSLNTRRTVSTTLNWSKISNESSVIKT